MAARDRITAPQEVQPEFARMPLGARRRGRYGPFPMTEPTAHLDTYIRDNLPPESLWPEMDYSVLPELAAYPSRLNAAVELLDKTVAEGFSDKPVLYWGDEVWTYADLQERSNRIANVLVQEF